MAVEKKCHIDIENVHGFERLKLCGWQVPHSGAVGNSRASTACCCSYPSILATNRKQPNYMYTSHTPCTVELK